MSGLSDNPPAARSKVFWRTSSYLSWLTADTASEIGNSLRGFAIPLVAYGTSHSLVTAGWLTTFAMVVRQVCALFGGTIVDRHPRKPLIICNATVQCLLWSLATVLLLLRELTTVHLLIFLGCSSCLTGLLGEATNAALRSIVSTEDYPKARSINEGRDATIGMASSPAGGILYGIGPWLPFAASAIIYAIAGAAGWQLSLQEETTLDKKNRTHVNSIVSFFKDFTEGWAWSWRRKRLPSIILAACLINFGLSGVQYTLQLQLIAVSTPAFSIGLLDTVLCLSMLVGAVAANILSNRLHAGKTICLSFLLMLISTAPLLVNNQYWLMLVCMCLLGLPVPLVNSMMLGFVFAKTDEHLQGRVSTAVSTPVQALSMFCSAIAGSLLPLIGFSATITLFVASILASALLALISPAIRTIPQAQLWATTDL